MPHRKLRGDGFSLLLPVYHGDDVEYFRQAFASSTAGQTKKPSEVVIVQDGPVSKELEAELQRTVAESEIPVNLVFIIENGGLTDALNLGLLSVTYEVVARMDADDISLPERFERQWEYMQRGFDLVGTGMIEFDSDPDLEGTVRVPAVGADRIRAHARTHNPFNHPTVMYRLRAVEKAGGYESFGKMEDYWLWVRMIQGGARVENISDPLLKYRVGAGAYSRRGGFGEARTEWRLQYRMWRVGFISFFEFARNSVVKGVYRLLPAGLKRKLFGRFIASGLPGDR